MMRIVVTQDNIQKGLRLKDAQQVLTASDVVDWTIRERYLKWKMGNCPVALALKCIFGQDAKIGVGTFEAVINGKQFILSRRIRKFIANFDQGKPVVPISFNLRASVCAST